MIHIRKARISDVTAIHAYLLDCSRQGIILARSLNQLYSHLRDFFVLHRSNTHGDDNDPGTILGCCALSICWDGLGEVRSLVVDESLRGQGYGRALVNACTEEARELHLSRLFTLTYSTQFFARMGYAEVDKESLPQKIWADCFNCPKFPNCDETAMLIELSEAPPNTSLPTQGATACHMP